jgi:hypothetical protein
MMAAASWLAGEPWSDHPRCTHPSLAAIARLVNDACTQTGRDRLLHLVPDLIGLRGRKPDLAPALVLLCTETARHQAPGGRAARLAARADSRRAARRLQRLRHGGPLARWTRLTDRLYARTVVERVAARTVAQLSAATTATADEDLLDLLRQALQLSRGILSHQLTPSVSTSGPVMAPTAAVDGRRGSHRHARCAVRIDGHRG